jgi:hypothetical protein
VDVNLTDAKVKPKVEKHLKRVGHMFVTAWLVPLTHNTSQIITVYLDLLWLDGVYITSRPWSLTARSPRPDWSEMADAIQVPVPGHPA